MFADWQGVGAGASLGERVGKGQSHLRSVVFLGSSQRDKFVACGEVLQTELSGSIGRLRPWTGMMVSLLFSRNTVWLWHSENTRDPALLGTLEAGNLKGAGRK